MPTLLIIDDDLLTLRSLAQLFRQRHFTVLTAPSAAEGLAIFARQTPDVVLLDIGLPDLSGLETFQKLNELDARTPVIFITGYGTTDTAIEAMKLGAYDYLVKPLDPERLQELVARTASMSQLMRVPIEGTPAEPGSQLPYALVGNSLPMQEVYKAIGRVAPMDLTVLILGESGTGKELVARAIYQHSRRANGPFLAINCAAIPEALLESELFGHEKGAFTGADRRRIGKFEQCHGGTLFLDEIGDMSALTQTKILRLLQDQQFERVGGSETIQTDVRLIAATNRNLHHLATGDSAHPAWPTAVDGVATPLPDRRSYPDRRRSAAPHAVGHFRHDLYFRLSGITITLPPLRDRGDDLGLLVDHFIRRFNPELGRDVRQVAPETMRLLEQHPWPGNIRELQGVIRQALLLATGPVLLPEFLPPLLRGHGTNRPPKTAVGLPGWEQLLEERLQLDTQDLYPEALALMERDLISRVLAYTEGNQLQAARMLGISRLSLRRKIRSLGMRIERSVVKS